MKSGAQSDTSPVSGCISCVNAPASIHFFIQIEAIPRKSSSRPYCRIQKSISSAVCACDMPPQLLESRCPLKCGSLTAMEGKG